MCFNYKVSFLTFVIGTVSSILLIKYGNKAYKIDNIVFGTFFIFIAAIQFMDFLFWIDIKNKIGINYITTLLGPLLNIGQPIILYLIKLIYFRPKLSNFTISDVFVLILNVLYLFYLIHMYITFILSSNLVTSTKYGHLHWPWLEYSNPYYYLILSAINIFYLTNFVYSLWDFLITYFLLYISYKYFRYSVGELWCFFGAFLPIYMIIISYYL
jgi:hypothetical protein